MTVFVAHAVIEDVFSQSDKHVLTMKGDCLTIIDVAAAMIPAGTFAWVAHGARASTSGVEPKAATFASVAIGPAASASGVRPKPAITATFSLTTSSCARRLVMSG